MLKKRLLGIGWKQALVLLLALFLIYRIVFAPLPVEISTVKIGSITEEVMGTGTLEARVHATISPKISGRIAEVLVDQGDKVTKGQTLLILDDADFRQQVDMARAELAAANASIEKTESQIKSSQATVKEANSTFSRMSPLVSSGVVSVDAFEKAQQQMDVAMANLNLSQSSRIEAEKMAAKAEASLKYYQERLADTVIRSPFDGLIIRRYRDPGSIAVPGSMVLDMISLDQLWISAWVDETQLGKLKVGQISKIVFRSNSKIELPGKVARISPQADSETREVLVDVTIDQMPEIWAIGQRAEVYIQTASKVNALLVPPNAIVWQKGKPGLFINNSGHAKWANVETGLQGKESVEIRKGLKAGDIVIWPRDTKKAITENRAVRIK